MDVGQPQAPNRRRAVIAVVGDDMGDEEQSVFLDQYKLAVEMADRVSARRGTANAFYFTVSSGLLAASETLSLGLATAAGILLALTWWLQLRSYRKLGAAKWQVITALEPQLPSQPFADEWNFLKAEPVERAVLQSARLGRAIKPLSRYAELGLVEQVVPLLFAVLFVIAIAMDVT